MENGRNGVVPANALLLPPPANKYRQRVELVNLGVMERKKHLTTRTGKSRIVGLLIASVLRRRILHRTLISAISASLLLIFALFSLFIPSPTPPHTHNNARVRSLLETHQDSVFGVPTNGGSCKNDLWSSRRSRLFSGCSIAGDNFAKANVKTHPDRYLLIATSGGLNQQRTGIIDAVVAAYLLNATLVVPELDHASFWKDTSNFSELFDTDWFITFLLNDVSVVKHLPSSEGKFEAPYTMRVPRKCSPKCYEDRVLPMLVKKRAVRLTKFDYRLANRLDEDLQKLRCRVNYHALKFTDSIQGMGHLLFERMKMKSKHFIALHLRFEPDMLAFSGCYYGGGEKEKKELGEIRKRWKNLHANNPDKVRRHGRCPLTPEEVGLMLRALGFGSDIHLYVASGEIYGGDKTLAPLKALFPNFHSKKTIATKEELAQFVSFSSRMAALDFIVCDDSDVFVSNNNGNMAKILAGRRRYFCHKPTIRPNTKKLNKLFMKKNNMTWEEFASRVRTFQIGFMGEPNELRPGSGEFHENPSSCICQNSSSESLDNYESSTRKNWAEEQFSEEELDWSGGHCLHCKKQNRVKGIKLDSIPLLVSTGQAELQEFFSD
ncbi:protein ROOT HAIR SPECIFIC 17-like [Vigna umbellata]|uniref:protein ROOT HAIR SPECIFIC 17-like n=1 Tax=Vigna umbellata TaxID=87088 RepID=UPI001F5EBEA3|nr:protein ROOT HAIR SPECIFIC 17-like [Vigna umbellata]